MRKVVVFQLIAIIVLLASCHNHSFAENWTSDDNMHWHAATCQHDVKKDEAAHTVDKGICTICGKNVISGKWVVDVDAYDSYLKNFIIENSYFERDISIYSEKELDEIMQELLADAKERTVGFKLTMFDDGESIVSLYETIEGTYRVTHQGALYMTADGEEVKLGFFDPSYELLTINAPVGWVVLDLPLIKTVD